MSQLNLTPEEEQVVLSALRSKANQYAAMFGCDDPAILDLIAKVEGQLPQPAVEAVEEVVATTTSKAKKAKAVEE